MADPAWREGNYYDFGPPKKGLAVARMIGHITVMSDQSMEEKFSRRLKNGAFSFNFDADSYLYITKAMDYFDLSGGKLMRSGKPLQTRFLVIFFQSDWLYPSYQSQDIVRELKGKQVDITHCELKSTYGHDAFLVEVEEQTDLIRHFLGVTLKGYHSWNGQGSKYGGFG